MLFDQLVRLFIGLLELGIVAVLVVVFLIGIGLLKIGMEGSGLLILLGVVWFVVSALKSRQ